jgi:hypothetical protein
MAYPWCEVGRRDMRNCTVSYGIPCPLSTARDGKQQISIIGVYTESLVRNMGTLGIITC